jgi:hypothetical protein
VRSQGKREVSREEIKERQMKKGILVLLLCLVFVGCAKETVTLTDTVAKIESKHDNWNGHYMTVTFEGGSAIFLKATSGGDLPQIGKKFNVVRHYVFGSGWCTLELADD